MHNASIGRAGVLALSAFILVASACVSPKDDHDDHKHAHGEDEKDRIYKGYFEDDEVKMRPLSDWRGDWQSIYPFLLDGSFEEFLVYKAEHGDKSVEEYREYYTTGYSTDVDRIVIRGDRVTFETGDRSFSGNYVDDGYEILTYEKGNRGVRFIFRKSGGDSEAPEFIQFSDHIIAPQKSSHYHLYSGSDRAALLERAPNWPTYFPSSMSGEEVADAMTAH